MPAPRLSFRCVMAETSLRSDSLVEEPEEVRQDGGVSQDEEDGGNELAEGPR